MKKLLVGVIGILLLGYVAIACSFFWPRAEIADALPIADKEKPDPVMYYLPVGWSIKSSKEQDLDTIYLPFLHRQLIGRRVRVVHAEGKEVIFGRPGSPYYNSRITRGTVVVLAETGQLLRIVLHGDIPAGPLPGEMSLDKAEDYFNRIGGGLKYVDLPKEPPQNSFQEILNRLYPGERASEQPHKAARITAVYVVQAYGLQPDKKETRWHVHFHDFQGPGSSFGPPLRWLCYDLDKNGKVLSSGTLP